MGLFKISRFEDIDNEELKAMGKSHEFFDSRARKVANDIYNIQNKCKHSVKERPKDYEDFGGGWHSGWCQHCGVNTDWYCPKSKNHICVYNDEHYGCKYCGQPDERK